MRISLTRRIVFIVFIVELYFVAGSLRLLSLFNPWEPTPSLPWFEASLTFFFVPAGIVIFTFGNFVGTAFIRLVDKIVGIDAQNISAMMNLSYLVVVLASLPFAYLIARGIEVLLIKIKFIKESEIVSDLLAPLKYKK